MEAYCMKCKEKREIKDPVAGFNAKSSPVTTGTCPVCGTKMFRMGKTDAHTDLVAPPKPEKVIKREGKLVIVESPAKAKTVGRFLGKGYTVRASVGHVRDLLKSQLSVDVENNFEPKYRVPNEKKEVVKEIKKLAQKAEEVYLATDPDREGESISWHLLTPARYQHGSGGCAAGASHSGPAGGLQHQPDSVGEGARSPVGGTRAIGGTAPDRRA